MKKQRVLPILLIVLLMGLLVPSVALAAPLADTIIGENEVVNNDVIVLEGDVEIHEGAVVNGDVVVFNGDAEIDGRVNGDLALFNGDLEASDTAIVTGDCVLVNGTVDSSGLLIECTSLNELNLDLAPLAALAPQFFDNVPGAPAMPDMPEVPPLPTMPAMPEMPEMPPMPEMPAMPEFSEPVPPRFEPVDDGGSFWGGLFGVMALAFFAGILGFMAGAIMPDNLRQIVSTARNKPVTSGAAGALTAVAVPSAIVLLIPLSIILTFVCIGLLGFPLMIVLALGLGAGLVLGWIAAGTWLGSRLFNRNKRGRSTAWTAALGTATLTLAVGLFGLIFSFGGVLLWLGITAIGLGAVALTRFGMKPYPARAAIDRSSPGDDESLDEEKLETVLLTLPPEDIPEVAPEK